MLRWNKSNYCPACGGYDDRALGDARCYGFLSSDHAYAHCTALHIPTVDPGDDGATPHYLNGPCKCGVDHVAHPAPMATPDPTYVYPQGETSHEALDWDEASHYYHYYRGDRLNGTYAFTVLRWDTEGGKVLRQGVRTERGHWVTNLSGIDKPYPLYRLQHLQGVEPHSMVFVVEGEKAADRLAKEDALVVTTAGGAGKSHHTDLSPLTYHDVIILPDNDTAGRKHALKVASEVYPMADSVTIVDLPGLGEKGDVYDWLEEGHTMEELYAAVNAAEPYRPEPRLALVTEAPVSGGEEWDDPIPFTGKELPAFPVRALPAWGADAVKEIARKTQTPVDMAADLYIAALSAAVGGKFRMEARPGWLEQMVWYSIIAMVSGSRKSPVFRFMVAPLVEWQKKEERDTALARSLAEAEKDTLERNLNELKNKAAKLAPSDPGRGKAMEDVKTVQEELESLVVPTSPSLLIDEITGERLVGKMAENDGRAVMLSEEGDALSIMAGRYSSGAPYLSPFKRGYDGGELRVDRMTRGQHVRNPALTVGLFTQPEVVAQMGGIKALRYEGQLARFVYSFPRALDVVEENQEDVDPIVRQRFFDSMYALITIPWATDQDGEKTWWNLSWSDEAFTLFDTFEQQWINPRKNDPLELGRIADWANKLAGKTARVAGFLHLAEHIGTTRNPASIPVSANTVKRAIAIMSYYVEHAKAAFDKMEEDDLLDKAQRVLNWVERQQSGSFTARDAWQPFKSGYKTQDEFAPVLIVLTEYGYIRAVDEEEIKRRHPGAGRKPRALYDVNPYFLQRAQEEKVAQQTISLDDLADFDAEDDPDPHGTVGLDEVAF